MASNDMSLLMEGAQFAFPPNFSGKETQYNRAGDRNFCVWLDNDLAARMEKDGWNVKYTKVRPDVEPDPDYPNGRPYLQVSVSWKNKPPRIVQITSRGGTPIDEDLVPLLDNVDVDTLDIIINPYEWDVNGNTGVKAYLKTMMLTIKEDYLEQKYADVLYGMGGGTFEGSEFDD